MNITADLINRVEQYRKTNTKPCNNYATEAAAEKAAQKAAKEIAEYFSWCADSFKPCRYVVAFVPSWGRWVVGFDLTELLSRPTSTGGYLGFKPGFFKY